MEMETPNKERLLLFVEALESGEYGQCQNTLTVVKDNGVPSHCCLGVATEVALANGLEGITRIPATGFMDGKQQPIVKYGYEGNEGVAVEENWLPDPVIRWYSLPYRNPTLADPDGGQATRSATALNDDLGLDFAEIARWFRHTYDLGPRPE